MLEDEVVGAPGGVHENLLSQTHLRCVPLSPLHLLLLPVLPLAAKVLIPLCNRSLGLSDLSEVT